MGQSLPLPTDAQTAPPTATGPVDPPRVTPRPARRRKAGVKPAPASPAGAAQVTGIEAFNAAIVRSKVRMPDIQHYTLERPRLLTWLEDHAHRRVRVLTAEAGYGKSTLVADHAQRFGRRTAWLRFEAHDVDWVGMLSYLVASLREAIPDFGVGAINLLQRVGVLNATRDMVLDMILAELDKVLTEPLTLVLDDFHVVQDGEDTRAIMGRMLEFAPSTMTFIVAGHRHPGALLARPMGQGQVVELLTSDLRFTDLESARLITNILGSPIDDDLVQILDERLAGWVASIQLVVTSLVGRSSAEVRSTIEELSSRSDPLYDFLATQVLSRVTGSMQRVLWVASLLERVEATLVIAAVGNTGRQASRRVNLVLKQAEESGVITRTGTSGHWWTFHPLVRDFMSSRLVASISRRTLLATHLRVARAAEPLDWAISAHHYIEAEHRADAMRVIRESAIQAVGTASWGAAVALVDRMPDQPVPEAVSVLRAYNLAARGQVGRAVALVEGLAPPEDDASAWGLVRVGLASLYLLTGELAKIRTILEEIASRDDLGAVVMSLARGIAVILDTNEGGRLDHASEVFREMGEAHAELGLPYFSGVGYHNTAISLFARGQYAQAVVMGRRAVDQFERTPSRHGVDSTHALLALAHLELGQTSSATEHLGYVQLSATTLADALADVAWIAAAQGDTTKAWIFLEQATAGSREGPRTPGALAATQYARVLTLLADGNLGAAAEIMAQAHEGSVEPDATVRHLTIAALLALVANDGANTTRLTQEALAIAEGQGAQHWTRCLRLLEAVSGGDADGFRRSMADLVANAKLSVLVLADVIVLGLGLADQVPSDIPDLIRACPGRWLPALRRVLQGPNRAAGLVAADLLATVGSAEDVSLLSIFERKHIRQASRRLYSRKLAHRISPTLVVHDLGRLRIQVGPRVVALSQSRRKSACLLAYLASRQSHAATRDQVLEVLWPNQSPDGASNSLHQTLFFLRRDIDPWYEDGTSVDYIVIEPDVVYLEPDLVQVDSAAFFRQISAAMTSGRIGDLGPTLLRDYHAKFALDFDYEDWSADWRGQVHSLYLEAVQATAGALLAERRQELAVDVLQRALAIDSANLELEASLVIGLHLAGATAAATHQFRHYAQALEEETGEPPESLAEWLESRLPEAD